MLDFGASNFSTAPSITLVAVQTDLLDTPNPERSTGCQIGYHLEPPPGSQQLFVHLPLLVGTTEFCWSWGVLLRLVLTVLGL